MQVEASLGGLGRSSFFSAHAQPSAFPVEVLVKSTADTQTELRVMCLLQSDPSDTPAAEKGKR